MLSVYMGRTGAPGPEIATARAERMRSLDPDIARVGTRRRRAPRSRESGCLKDTWQNWTLFC